MASTMQMMKPPAHMEQWNSLFPNFTTLTGSSNFIKKLTALSLSAITYIRDVFPDAAYGERQLCGLKLKILTEGSQFKGVEKFINLVKSCFEAIDNKYLEQLSIGFCTDVEKKDEVVEMYHMNFRYTEDEFSVKNNSSSIQLTEKDPTVEATLYLLKTILSIQGILGPLPKKAYLTMKMLYNAEITPEDYLPPGFEPSDNQKFIFPSNAVKLKLGNVSTELNKYTMYVKSVLSKEPLQQLMKETVLCSSAKSPGNRLTVHHRDEVCLTETCLGSSSDTIKDSLAVKNPSENIHCLCNCKQDSGTDILQCVVCDAKQHSICYGILQSDENESEFYCNQCITEAPAGTMQQDWIYSYEGKEQQELCATRRALVFCASSSLKPITAAQLEKGLKCNKELSKDLIKRLEFEGFIRKAGLKYIVNVNKITNSGYREYFPKQENKENMKISKPIELSKEKRLYEEPDIEEVFDESKRKPRNTQFASQNQLMDFETERGVKDLNLRGLHDNQVIRKSRRSFKSKIIEDDDSDDLFQPSKKRCTSIRWPIDLTEFSITGN